MSRLNDVLYKLSWLVIILVTVVVGTAFALGLDGPSRRAAQIAALETQVALLRNEVAQLRAEVSRVGENRRHFEDWEKNGVRPRRGNGPGLKPGEFP